MDVLKLRPHHINCLFFYEGKGYSKVFVENMDNLVKSLRENSNQLIRLERGNDTLCKACPNLKDSVCISSQKIDFLDQETLRQYDLKENQVFSFKKVIEVIYKNYSYNKFKAICNSCEWYKQGVCTSEKIIKQQQVWGCNK